MNDLSVLTHQLEYFFIKTIINGLQSKTLTEADAKTYANAFLAIEPFTSSDDAHSKISEFTSQYPAFATLKDYVDGHKREQGDLIKIDKMRQYIKENKIEDAIAVAKG